jgi:RimJ/RimL family protein N-acetyltransferase
VYLTPHCTPPTIRIVPAPSWPLESGRLRLRPFEDADLRALHAIHSDAGVARWLYNEPRTLAETRALLARKIHGSSLRAGGDWLGAAAELRTTGELVADVSLLWASEAHRQGELGFLVHPAHQGLGYATEAAHAMLGYAFGELGLHRVVGRLEARNTASARVLEKLGMRREAHLVENEWVKGEWQSELVYAILAREWRDATAGGGARDRGY